MYILTEDGLTPQTFTSNSLTKIRAQMAKRIREVMPEMGVTPEAFEKFCRESPPEDDKFVTPVCQWHIHRVPGALVSEQARKDILEKTRKAWQAHKVFQDLTSSNELCQEVCRQLSAYLDPDDDAEPPLDHERDYYRVNEDHTVTLLGWMEERDNNCDGFLYDIMPRQTFVYGDWPDTFDTSGVDMTDWAYPYTQYNEDVHFEDATDFVDRFFAHRRFEHLAMALVNEKTQPGHYWCHFDEEPGRHTKQV